MKTTDKNAIGNNLDGKFFGMCDGARIYKVCRGFYQVQNFTKPNLSTFNGTKREVESALGHKIVRFY